MFSLMAPTFTLYDDFNFPAIASRCDDAPSTRGPGDARFSAGLRETLAGDRSRIRLSKSNCKWRIASWRFLFCARCLPPLGCQEGLERRAQPRLEPTVI